MEVRSAFPQNSHKCPICNRNGIKLGIEAARTSHGGELGSPPVSLRSPVWLCVECDCYWYWLRGKREIADLLSFGAGI